MSKDKTKPKLIYLACPYSHGSPYMRHTRFLASCEAAARIFNSGDFVFSPISHTHPIKEVSHLDGDWKYWAAYDEKMLLLCDAVVVLTLPGWKQSLGVKAELKIAKENGIPITFIEPL